MSRHIHADLMALYALDAAETDKPWQRWEYLKRGAHWTDCHINPEWWADTEYRRKTKTIHINGIEVPEPCRESLKAGTRYYMPDLVESVDDLNGGWFGSEWGDDDIDHTRLKAGIVHLTKEAADMHAKALLHSPR